MTKNTNSIDSKLDLIRNYLDSKNLDYYDIRLERTESTSISIENKYIKNVNNNSILGIGIRILKNKKLGFCSTTKIDNYKQIIDDCIKNTSKLSKKTNLKNFAENEDKVKFKHKKFNNKEIKIKVKELKEINSKFIKKEGVLQSDIKYIEIYKKKYFINPYSYIYQEFPYCFMYSMITGKRNNIIERNINRGGNIGGLEVLTYNDKEKIINENNIILKELLNSKPCPAIKSDILITPEITDLLAHEAIGHAAEADAIINKSSVLKKGQILANKDINVVDNPNLKEFGFFKYDDEGIRSEKTEIIKNGIVKDYLLNIETATELKLKSNGSARAESFDKEPIVRMSNTYFETGREKYKDIISDFNGYLLKGFAGGEVDPSVGTFMFGIKQAYKIKNGKIIDKFKQASISGNILNYLKNISAISDKLGKFEIGFCGKDGQTAFVGGSGPHLKIDNVIIGGTEHD